jgi:TetR/AcrR family transcriptional repressor of nem operon
MDDTKSPARTSQQILDIAQRLVQTRGFNAFSYADIAAALGITKASLHYHFASKASLGVSLIERYGLNFGQLLAGIDRDGGRAPDKLRRYAGIYAAVLVDDRMCLCGMLAAEFETLPRAMQVTLESFFDMNEAWLARVLEEGRAEGSLTVSGSGDDAAQYIIGTLEGVMILARSDGGVARFEAAVRRLLGSFGV